MKAETALGIALTAIAFLTLLAVLVTTAPASAFDPDGWKPRPTLKPETWATWNDPVVIYRQPPAILHSGALFQPPPRTMRCTTSFNSWSRQWTTICR